ncbi:MAG: hypothetical protein PUC32_07760 [Oscillospiraceae bacterium]|nr:hypothetical protein [Oscillospiraceae bacterium]
MQAIAETIFDAFYLGTALVLGVLMLVRGRIPLVKKAGAMTVLLGAGDAFHLVPRCYALWTTGLEQNAAALGLGKWITSITMTVFYLILYYIWRDRYEIRGRMPLTITMWGLALLRIALCFLPQNDWFAYRQPLFYGILRNIPFAVMGVLILVLFAAEIRRSHDKIFRFLPLAVALSFGFYLPVVLFSGVLPVIGVLMIPKTLAYVWIVLMCWHLHRTTLSNTQTA